MRILRSAPLVAATFAAAFLTHAISIDATPRPDQQTRGATGSPPAPLPTTPAVDAPPSSSANNTKTVVLIVGSEDDRARVKASMANVRRRVVLALLNRSVKDDTNDGFTNVQGASGAGWVKTVMLAK